MDFLVRKFSGTSAPVKNGAPSSALIESVTDTGMTITSPSAGPEAPVYKLGLQVTPIGGAGAPYSVEIKEAIPRLFIPMVLPGAQIGVLIDPLDPSHVSADFTRMGAGAAAPSAPPPPGGFQIDFDANGQPASGEVAAIATGVRSGQVNTIKGSADQLLASGMRGTAVITTAMPLGKTVRDINPAADPSRLNDPVWMFTVECEVPGVGSSRPSSAIACRWPSFRPWLRE